MRVAETQCTTTERMAREKTVIISESSNELAGEKAKETVREQDGVREVIREVTREFRKVTIGSSPFIWSVSTSVLVKKASIIKSHMTSEQEDEIIKIAHEAVSKQKENIEVAKYISGACDKKYG